jgi:alkylation response protein AidB-like acyl-CoA dehydrogenase
MIELSGRLLLLRDAVREAAMDLRVRALSVDADPDAMDQHIGCTGFLTVQTAGTPPRYRAWSAPARKLFDDGSCLEAAVANLELARGDAGMILACPGPALAGVAVDYLGSHEQQELFYRRLEDGRTWTFFAMTEPGRGNDATAMRTRLDPDGSGGYLLSGGKRYIGNGARGGIGVVFARTGKSVLSIRAALVEVPARGWSGRRLDMIGLRGAYLSELEFDGVPVAGHMLLGGHLPAARRGMWGAIRTFNKMRIQVAALAVGTAMAICEYVAEQRTSMHRARRAGLDLAGLDLAVARAEAARRLVYLAAARVDQDPDRGYLSCAAKLAATRMAVETARWGAAALGPASLIEHPLLEKWTRDVCSFEFMEGTDNIQRIHVAHGYQAGAADAAAPRLTI